MIIAVNDGYISLVNARIIGRKHFSASASVPFLMLSCVGRCILFAAMPCYIAVSKFAQQLICFHTSNHLRLGAFQILSLVPLLSPLIVFTSSPPYFASLRRLLHCTRQSVAPESDQVLEES